MIINVVPVGQLPVSVAVPTVTSAVVEVMLTAQEVADDVDISQGPVDESSELALNVKRILQYLDISVLVVRLNVILVLT